MNSDYLAFLYACTFIGGVAESSGRFQERLYDSIEDKWGSMTVTELLESIDKAKDEFNKLEKIARGES